MPPRASFERRLLISLVLFSVVPSLLLIWAGGFLLSEAVELRASAAAFENIGESGRELLALSEATGDPALAEAAARHREVLSSALLQSGRWEYLNERVLQTIPFLALVLTALLIFLAVRAARAIAHELARPIGELVGWAGMIARGEPLPELEPGAGRAGGGSELDSLRRAFRAMSDELAVSRARAIEAERARTWVTMARSVAHELKNSLTPLRLAVRSLHSTLGPGPATDEPLEVITAEAERLDGLARAFSQFGRLPEGPLSDVDITELLDHLLRTHLPGPIERRLAAAPDVPLVHARHDVLSRAFSNVLLNAAEALGDDGGSVEVEVTRVSDRVRVVVRDSGPGIASEDLGRAWDPDFTTKARGTGLGLALVRQAIHAHGGEVRLANAPTGGAEVTIEIPVAPGAGAEPNPVTAPWRAS